MKRICLMFPLLFLAFIVASCTSTCRPYTYVHKAIPVGEADPKQKEGFLTVEYGGAPDSYYPFTLEIHYENGLIAAYEPDDERRVVQVPLVSGKSLIRVMAMAGNGNSRLIPPDLLDQIVIETTISEEKHEAPFLAVKVPKKWMDGNDLELHHKGIPIMDFVDSGFYTRLNGEYVIRFDCTPKLQMMLRELQFNGDTKLLKSLVSKKDLESLTGRHRHRAVTPEATEYFLSKDAATRVSKRKVIQLDKVRIYRNAFEYRR